MKNIKLFIAILTFSLLVAATSFGQEATPLPTPTETPTRMTSTDSTDIRVSPKPEGTIRIGIVTAKVQLGQDVSGQEAAGEAIRQQWMSLLSGAAIEAVAIESRLPSQIGIEAELKACDFVLYSSLSKKRKSSIFGSLVKVAVPVLTSAIPVTGNVDPNGTTANTVQQTVMQAGKDVLNNTIASATSAKDAVTLTFILTTNEGANPALKKSLKAKAQTDGEDVISPLIEKAANEVAQAALKK